MTSKKDLLKKDDTRSGRLGLLGLVALVAAIAAALYKLGGPPHLPHQLPSQGQLLLTLEGSDVPLAAFAYLLTMLTWLLLAYVVLSVVLHTAVVVGERAGCASHWVMLLRAASRRFTMPLVRHMVEAAFITTIVLNTGRAIPALAATPSTTVSMVAPPAASASPQRDVTAADATSVEYTVQHGDTLWGIAEHVYGDGAEFPRLVDANAGRQMSDGRRFTQAGVIDVGWTLAIPLPSHAISAAGGGLEYVVQPNDTLSGIAARLLGDPDRWQEVFQLNEGNAHDPEGRVLTDPHDIWPGMRLVLVAPQPPAPPAATPAPVDQPVVPLQEPSPSPTAEAAASAAPAAAEPAPVGPAVPSEMHRPGPPAGLAYGAASAAAAAAAAFLARRRRVRRSLSEPPVRDQPPAPIADGFAEAEPARSFAYRLQGGESEPAILLARHIEEVLGTNGLGAAEIVTVAASRSKADLTLAAGMTLRDQLLTFGPEIEDGLGCAASVSETPNHDILLELSRLKLASVVAQLAADGDLASSWLVPIGVRPGQQDALHVNWRQIGNLLIAGLPGGGAHTILNSLLASLVARCRPGDLHLMTLASERALDSSLLALEHQRRVVDMHDPERVSQALDEVQREMDERLDAARPAAGDDGPTSRLVVIVSELADLGEAWAKLDDIAAQGPAVGIHILAATLRSYELTEDVIASFGSRLVLQTMDDDESIRLIGQPDAADLSGGGDYLLRIEGRRTIRARGFRVAEDRLRELADAVAEAFGGGHYAPEAGAAVTFDADAEPLEPTPDEGRWARPAEEPLDLDAASAEQRVYADAGGGSGAGLFERQADEGLSTRAGVEPAAMTPSDELMPSGSDGGADRIYEDVAIDFVAEDLGADDEAGSTIDVGGRGLRALAHEDADRAMGEEDEGRREAVGVRDLDVTIEVRCLGPYEVAHDGRQLSFSGKDGPHYMPWELLAYLAVQPHGRAPCDKVCEVLWPGVNPKLSRKRLHTAMWRLRTVLSEQVAGLPSEVVRLDPSDMCQLSPTLVRCDAWRFNELDHAAEKDPARKKVAYAELVGLYRGELFSDCGYDWIHSRYESGLTPREQYRERYMAAATELAGIYRRDGDVAQAATLYKAILVREPMLEDIVRELYQCYALLGDKAALTREHRHLLEALRDELRDPEDPEDDPELYEPDPETSAAYERALASLTHRSADQASVAGGTVP